MEYSTGKLGRVIAARFHDGENVYAGIEEIAQREKLESAMVFIVGGARRGKVVVGPKEGPQTRHTAFGGPAGPIEPMVRSFDDAREIVGFGTIFPSDDKPSLHMHAAMGRGDEVIVGCPRQGLDVFLVLEVILIELLDLGGRRELDPASGLRLLSLLPGRRTTPPTPNRPAPPDPDSGG